MLLTDFSSALERGWAFTFLFVFLGGILTSLTPCVFPMIPITVGVIGARRAKSRWYSFSLSLVYVLGIALTYAGMGIFSAVTGAFVGSALQNRWVVGGVALLFASMGLSLLGLFTLQLPPTLATRLSKVGGDGWGGVFMLGLISGLVASPCVGPVLVGLLTYIGKTQDWVLGFFLMLTFAFGIGLLFILLGTFSGLIAHMPASGPWQNRIKQGMGILFIGVGVYYLQPILSAPPPPSEIRWIVSEEEGLALARREKKPAMLDLYAEWCVACKELDRFTYTDPAVIEKLQGVISIKVDATTLTPEIERIQKKYEIVGLPTVLFFDREGNWLRDKTLTGFVKAPPFLKLLESVENW